MNKQELREKYKILRDKIPNREALDHVLTDKILKTDLYFYSKTVLLYYPIGSEFNTLPLCEQAKKDKKLIGFPKIVTPNTTKSVNKNKKILEFYKYSKNFEKGEYDIPVPMGTEKITDFDKTLAIVPALAIDEQGFRLGYGGGFYDLFLAENPQIRRMSVCYPCCYAPKLPINDTDIQIDVVVY